MLPKPLPNGWYQGQTIGSGSTPRITSGSSTAPTRSTRSKARGRPEDRRVLQDGAAGARVRSGGQPAAPLGRQDGPGYQWPASNHGLNIDNKGNVWIGGNGAADGHILKFTQDGKFLMQVGQERGHAATAWRQDRFFQVAKMFFDAPTNEVYVADGYGNRRVAVIDGDSGKFKRFWGAYGNQPDDEAAPRRARTIRRSTYQQFRGPVHCADVSVDGLVYVCDRTSNRLQVFTPDGKFVKEIFIAARLARRRLGLGRRVLEGSAAEVPVRGGRPQPEAAHLRPRSR